LVNFYESFCFYESLNIITVPIYKAFFQLADACLPTKYNSSQAMKSCIVIHQAISGLVALTLDSKSYISPSESANATKNDVCHILGSKYTSQ